MRILVLATAGLLAAIPSANAFEMFGAPGDQWSGPYVGIYAGMATGASDLDLDFDFDGDGIRDDDDTDVSGGGLFSGAQAGFDWQFGPVVVGAVADIGLTTIETEARGVAFGNTISAGSELDYLGTVRGRIGAPFDRLLVYTHGGFAYGGSSQEFTNAQGVTFENDTSRHGWVAGVGVEYLMSPNTSFQTEYGYYNLGEDDIFSDNNGSAEDRLDFHALRAAFNVRF